MSFQENTNIDKPWGSCLGIVSLVFQPIAFIVYLFLSLRGNNFGILGAPNTNDPYSPSTIIAFIIWLILYLLGFFYIIKNRSYKNILWSMLLLLFVLGIQFYFLPMFMGFLSR
jgi:hypothetical protein